MAKKRGQTLKLIFGVALTVASGTAITWQLLPDRPDTASAASLASAVPKRTPTQQNTEDDAEDAAFEQGLNRNVRWSYLPSKHAIAYRDPSGHVWFDGNGFTPEVFKRSVERAARGLSHIIRGGGHILLVDSTGRYWGKNPMSREIVCFDGKAWLPPHASAPASNPAAPASQKFIPFSDVAFEDSAGNCYFLSGSNQVPAQLHCFSKAGQWTVIDFPNHAKLPGDMRFAEQTNGRIAIYSAEKLPQGDGMSILMAKALMGMKDHAMLDPFVNSATVDYIWDGQQFTAYTPKKSPSDTRRLNQALPLPDGSMLTTYLGSDEVALNWPPGTSNALDTAAQKLIVQLDDRDPTKRDAAANELLKLGPPVRAKISAAIDDPANQSAQRQDSLHAVADKLSQAATPEKALDDTLFGGRYQLSGILRNSVALDGTVHLFAKTCTDVDRQESFGPSFITINRRGEWSVTPVPDKPELAWLPSAIDDADEDVRGQLWTSASISHTRAHLVVNPNDFSVRPAFPPGLKLNNLSQSDLTGRCYFAERDGWFIFNPNAPEVAPALPMKLVNGAALITRPGDKAAWISAALPKRIMADGTLKPVQPPHDLICREVVPLRNGAAFLDSEPRDAADEVTYPFFWDGQKLKSAVGGAPHEWIEQRFKDLQGNAPLDFSEFGSGNQLVRRLGSDRGVGLWCLSEEHDENKEVIESDDMTFHLEYFDGNSWYDAWDLLQPDKRPDDDPDAPKPRMERDVQTMGAVDQGRSVLVYSRAASQVSSIMFEGGKLVRTPLATAPGIFMPLQITSSSGTSWFWANEAGPGTGTLGAYHDGKLEKLPWAGMPVLADSKDRLWCVGAHALSVVQDKKTTSVAVPDLDEHANVVESRDGRLWLLHSSGLDQLSLNNDSLTLTHHWNLGVPLNLCDAFCDEANGLWLSGVGGAIGRIQLPDGK